MQRYCKDNPGRFANADAAYVLSFAVIMLNTDAHNPSAGESGFADQQYDPTLTLRNRHTGMHQHTAV